MNLSKISLKHSVLVISLAGIALFFSLGFSTQNHNPKIALSSAQADAGFPVRIRIPKINIDTSVEKVGLTPEGAMSVPMYPQDTAWFDLGPRPGELGSSVIDGHSGYKDNKPAVFDNLGQLQKGDKVYIEDEKGEINTFVVRELRNYDPNQNAEDVFSSDDGISHLNLITCGGAWDETDKTHSSRLVVFTDKETE